MTRDNKLYYEDIAEAIREIEEFMGDLSFDRFAKRHQSNSGSHHGFYSYRRSGKTCASRCAEEAYRRFHGQKSWGCATS